jgi:hypothetical protein
MTTAEKTLNLHTLYERRLAVAWRKSPYVLRVAGRNNLPVPVLVIKERHGGSPGEDSSQIALPLNG